MTVTNMVFRMSGKRSGMAIAKAALAASVLALMACSSPEEKVEKFSQSGQEYLEDGDLGRANVQFQNALKINEEHVPSLLGLADIAEKRQDFKNMFGILQRIVRVDPNNAEAHVKLGQLYLISSDESAALEHADKALALDPENVSAVALKAGVKLRLSDYVGAVELAKQVTAVAPANPEAVTVLATERLLNDDAQSALAELDKALEADPDVAILHLLRIRVLEKLGRQDEVDNAYLDLIERHPQDASYRKAYTNELLQKQDFAGASEQLERVIELEPKNLDMKIDLIRIIYTGEGADAAEARIQKFIDAEPDNAEVKFLMVDFLVREQRPDEAKAILDRLAASDDRQVSLKAKNKIAGILYQGGEKDKAGEIVSEILAADSRNTEALMRRASLNIDTQNFDAAIVDLRAALDNDPDSAEARVLMASAFERQGNYNFAQAELAKALDVSNKDPKIANIFAKFLVRNEKLARAEEVLVESLGAYPNDTENLKMLAGVRLSMEDWQGAEEIAALLERAEQNEEYAQNVRAVAMTGLKDYQGIIDRLTEQNEEAPLESRPLATLVAAYLRSDRSDEAEQLLTGMLENDPDNYAVYILLAQVYGKRGEDEEAEKVLIEATNRDPLRSEAYELLYRYYLRTDQVEKASALVDEGLEAAPRNVALRVFKADILLTTGERAEAYELYTSLLKDRPNDPIIANNFVSLTSELRTDEESINKALEVSKTLEDKENPFFKDTIGWANYRAGNFGVAVEYLSAAAEAVQGNAEILYHLGAAQLAAGSAEAARENLEKSLEAGGEDFPYETEVRELLNQM
jgi:Tfp pilus assembly protein PilF